MKWLIKLLYQSGETLADYAAEGIVQAFNKSTDDLRIKVAKSSAYSQGATRIANTLTGSLADGQVYKARVEALQHTLTPLFDKLLALV